MAHLSFCRLFPLTVCALSLSCSEEGLPVELDKGLVAHYEFSGDGRDISGNGSDAEVDEGVAVADRHGVEGGAVRIDGSSIRIPSNDFFQPTQDGFTICAWLLVEEPSWQIIRGDEMNFIIRKDNDGDGSWGIYLLRTSKDAPIGLGSYLRDVGSSGAVNTGYAGVDQKHEVPLGEFFHACLSVGLDPEYFDPEITDDSEREFTEQIAVNGQREWPENIEPERYPPQSAPLIIGGFRGAIDELRFYNRALNKNEIAALAQQ